MLGEELGLVLHHLGGLGFERFSDQPVQALTRSSQQGAVRRILDQCVLEAVDRVGRSTALEHQLGSDETSESCLQLLIGKARNCAQKLV
jgi:hypothetical protein